MPALFRVPARYDPAFGQALASRILALENFAHLRGRDVEIGNLPQANLGNREPRLILRSPDGTRWAVTVDNAGALSTTAL